MNSEGRIIQADFGDLSVLSIYLPSGSSKEERQALKMEFIYERFLPHLKGLQKDGRKYIICGDWNIAHKKIDLKNTLVILSADHGEYLPFVKKNNQIISFEAGKIQQILRKFGDLLLHYMLIYRCSFFLSFFYSKEKNIQNILVMRGYSFSLSFVRLPSVPISLTKFEIIIS